MRSRTIVLALSALVLGPALAPTSANAAWQTRTLGAGGEYSSVAVDSLGRLHISHLDGDSNPANYALRHAWYDGSVWRSQLIEDGDVGWWSSIAADSRDRLHVAYHGDRTGLRYALYDGAWTITLVAPGAGYANSIAVDANDDPHIVTVSGNGELLYARREGTEWRIETIPGGAIPFLRTSLVLDANGAAHVAFTRDASAREVCYATNANGFWEVEHVANGEYSSMVLDPAGRPHVVLTTSVAGEPALWHAFRDGVSWLGERIVEGVFDNPAAACGRDGSLHVAAGGYDFRQEFLAYGELDGAWTFARVRGGNVGFEMAITLDRLGLPVISCRAAGPHETSSLFFARQVKGEVGGVWESVSTSQAATKQVVKGKFRVENEGTAAARRLSVRFFLSDDDVFDTGDAPVGKRKQVPVLNPGQRKAVPLTYKAATSVTGKFLIALVEVSDRANEADPSDNEVAALIP